jgi:hypothetical protein
MDRTKTETKSLWFYINHFDVEALDSCCQFVFYDLEVKSGQPTYQVFSTSLVAIVVHSLAYNVISLNLLKLPMA